MRDYAITFRVGAAARNLDALDSRLTRLQDKAHKLGFTIEETRVKGYESRGRRTDAGETTGSVPPPRRTPPTGLRSRTEDRD